MKLLQQETDGGNGQPLDSVSEVDVVSALDVFVEGFDSSQVSDSSWVAIFVVPDADSLADSHVAVDERQSSEDEEQESSESGSSLEEGGEEGETREGTSQSSDNSPSIRVDEFFVSESANRVWGAFEESLDGNEKILPFLCESFSPFVIIKVDLVGPASDNSEEP